MTKTIEQLQVKNAELEKELLKTKLDLLTSYGESEELSGRIAELEADLEFQTNARIQDRKDAETNYKNWNAELKKQLAAEQLNNKRLRDALQEYIDEHEECTDADDWMAMLCSIEAHHVAEEALALPRDTSALDTYVAEKVKDAKAEVLDQVRHFKRVREQRDLAVEALEDVRKELQQSNDRLYEEREIWDRVMGDGVKKLERLELELDDCLYVLESLWDKTCNKEVTEKWAGILIRNKRGIGASSAEDSSEPTSSE